MNRRSRYGWACGTLLLSACLQDVTVGFDTKRLVDGRSDAGTPDAAPAADAATELDSAVDLDGSHPDTGPCTPDHCPLDPEQSIKTEAPCPNEEARACERDESGTCAWRCPDAPPPDLRCGGLHLVPPVTPQCGADTFCRLDLGSCDPSLMGLCTIRPGACVNDSEPVCGCDGITYNNACEAFRLAVSLRSLGVCP